jgi:ABC-type lipoprotein export system ATPase subunit
LLEGEASCWENVLTTAVYGGVPRADRPWRAEVALEAVGLLHRARHKAGKLNGGDRKKLALAQAIVRIDDGLLLLDEPTAHLSERAAEEILFLLQHLNVTQGCTILAITHDLRWAAKFSPHWYRLFDGRLTRDQPGPPVPAATPEAARPPLSGTPVVLGPVLPREGGKRNWPLMVRGDSQCLRLVPRGVH